MVTDKSLKVRMLVFSDPSANMLRFFRVWFEWIYQACPRFNHAVIWGWPDHEDQGVAVEAALRDTPLQRVVVLMTDPACPAPGGSGSKTLRVKKNSPAGIWWFLTARYVFFTHPCFTRRFPEDVVSVNLWHGMPVKKIGWLLEGDSGIECALTPVTSPFWGEIMRRAMEPRGELPDFGLPRNDRLFGKREAVLAKLGLAGASRLIAWLPTYRRSVRGLRRADGGDAGNVFEMPDVDPEKLNAWLARRGTVLVVKPHPMAAMSGGSMSHLWIIDDNWLAERRLTLYQLLGATDALVSDISSVVIDYLLLDRPVIHAFADLESYHQSRGFTVEPIDDFFAGPVVRNVDELKAALEAAMHGEDPQAERRRRLLELSHTHRDGGATRRLLERVGLGEGPRDK
jgi:CDP-glycerol glycerophosphotransferase (TagB/SpsB family)